MRYRAVKLGTGAWAVQWRIGYVFRGLEQNMDVAPVLYPHGLWRPTKLFLTQRDAETYIYALLAEEAEAKRNKKQKGPWLPEYYL